MMQPIDQQLLAQAQQGDEPALAGLITRMMPAIRKGAAGCTAPGLDYDDAVQEGLIGLFHAVKSYDAAQGVPFAAYADACIRHSQQDAQRAALRKKHAPLNFSVPLPVDDSAALPGPEEQAIEEERYADVVSRMDTLLSAFERETLLLRLDGCSAAESARRLGCTTKAVANALARARRKLRGD